MPGGDGGPVSTKPGEPDGSPHIPSTISDDEILRLKAGDISALDLVFRVYGDRIFRVCHGILGNRSDAEDATQEIFMRIFEKANKFSGKANFTSWVLRLAANHTRNFARAKTARRRISGPTSFESKSRMAGPVEETIALEDESELFKLLQLLPSSQRQVLVLREIEGLSYGQLAEILDVPPGTVTSRLTRARGSLLALAKKSGINFLNFG